MSPNQRKKEKTQFSLWMTPEEREMLVRAAERRSMSMSDFLKMLVAIESKRIGVTKKGDTK
ncbi:MAG: hypothetical protein FWF96_00640 [Kiritimatiellaeota bacterium]|nr:hypothetical protein [Kiritimatiellota bacterium]